MLELLKWLHCLCGQDDGTDAFWITVSHLTAQREAGGCRSHTLVLRVVCAGVREQLTNSCLHPDTITLKNQALCWQDRLHTWKEQIPRCACHSRSAQGMTRSALWESHSQRSVWGPGESELSRGYTSHRPESGFESVWEHHTQGKCPKQQSGAVESAYL